MGKAFLFTATAADAGSFVFGRPCRTTSLAAAFAAFTRRAALVRSCFNISFRAFTVREQVQPWASIPSIARAIIGSARLWLTISVHVRVTFICAYPLTSPQRSRINSFYSFAERSGPIPIFRRSRVLYLITTIGQPLVVLMVPMVLMVLVVPAILQVRGRSP